MKIRSRTTSSSNKQSPCAASLFSRRGRQDLSGWVHNKKTLFAFDLDGTLVPLIKDFTKVKLAAASRKLLVELARRHHVVVVSGRGINDLKKIVSTSKVKLVGNHGLEGVKKLTRPLHVKAWHAQLALALSGQSGVQIEDKKISISVHYRNSPDHRVVRKIIFKTLPTLEGPLRVIMGKSVFNLIPDYGQNKGWAVQQLMRKYRCERAIYVGDDVTDEDVFVLRDKKIMGIHVGSPAKTAANYFVRKQSDVGQILAHLAELP